METCYDIRKIFSSRISVFIYLVVKNTSKNSNFRKFLHKMNGFPYT